MFKLRKRDVRRLARSLRFRLTVSYALLFLIMLVGTAVVFRARLASELSSSADTALNEQWAAIKGAYLRIDRSPEVDNQYAANWYFDADDPDETTQVLNLKRVLLVADENGNPIPEVISGSDAHPPSVSTTYDDLGRESPAEIRLYVAGARKLAKPPLLWAERRSSKGEPFWIRSGLIWDEHHRVPFYISIGVSLAKNHEVLANYTWTAFVVVVPLALILASLLGWIMAGRTLTPLREVAQAAQRVSGSNLSLRIPTREAGDELDYLILTFNRMTERLEASFQQMKQFSTDVSHELRTPITAIRGQLEVALFTAKTTDQYREAMFNALQDTDRLSQIVRALLLLSQAESGQLVLQKARLNLGDLIRELVEQMQIPAEAAGVHLTADAASDCFAAVDRVQFERLINNLLSNAFKFTFSGEIGIAIDVATDGKTVAVAVRDTGTGIPAAELPHLFERFHRVAGSKGRSIEGSGIGLALVHELIKLHGGEIRVESEVGRGSTFTVLLPSGSAHLPADRVQSLPTSPAWSRPRAATFIEQTFDPDLAGDSPVVQSAPGHSPPDDRDTSSPRILLAEDNADMRRYIERLLRSEACAVEAVTDGAAALRAARSHPPDLILSDVMMPGMDGFELLAAVRADAALRATPVVLISARAGEEARVEGFEANADDYLIKPFTARELLARVRSNLTTARLRREAEALRQQSEARLRIALDAASAIGAWDWDIKKNRVYVDARFARMFSVDPASAAAGAPLDDFILGIHPEDRARVSQAIQNAIENDADYKAEFRIVQPDRTVVWVLARGRPYYDDKGAPDHFPGVVIDITDRVKAEQQRTLLVNELNHRVKNTLATVQSLAAQSMRGTDNAADARSMFESRLAALSRAHDLLTLESWEGANLQDVVDRALEPFQTGEGRLTTTGPFVRLSPRQALAFSMAVHELATNATKYGAISNDLGRVQIAWSIDRDHREGLLKFRWVEEGGPSVMPPQRAGFGSRLIQRGLSTELGGDATIDFRPGGVVCVISSPIENPAPLFRGEGGG